MKRMLMFLHSDDSRAGGAEEVMFNVCQYLLREGWRVDVLFSSPIRQGGWNTPSPNLHLHYIQGHVATRPFHLLGWFWKHRHDAFDRSFTSLVDHTAFLGLMKRIGLLHVEKMVARESTSIFARFTGMKLRRMKLAYRLGYPAVNLLICQTDFMKQSLLEHLPWLQQRMKVCVIPNPVNADKIRNMEREAIDTATLRPYIVSAGRYIHEKGFDLLIRAFAKLREERPELRLLILGDGVERKNLQKIVDETGQTKAVHLFGLVKNVYPYFRQAEMCVVSSRVEGFPNVLLQMMSQNDKVVSTLCAGGIDRIAGLHTCPPDDEEALLEAMQHCLSADNGNTRELFDEELRRRGIGNFVKRIQEELLAS